MSARSLASLLASEHARAFAGIEPSPRLRSAWRAGLRDEEPKSLGTLSAAEQTIYSAAREISSRLDVALAETLAELSRLGPASISGLDSASSTLIAELIEVKVRAKAVADRASAATLLAALSVDESFAEDWRKVMVVFGRDLSDHVAEPALRALAERGCLDWAGRPELLVRTDILIRHGAISPAIGEVILSVRTGDLSARWLDRQPLLVRRRIAGALLSGGSSNLSPASIFELLRALLADTQLSVWTVAARALGSQPADSPAGHYYAELLGSTEAPLPLRRRAIAGLGRFAARDPARAAVALKEIKDSRGRFNDQHFLPTVAFALGDWITTRPEDAGYVLGVLTRARANTALIVQNAALSILSATTRHAPAVEALSRALESAAERDAQPEALAEGRDVLGELAGSVEADPTLRRVLSEAYRRRPNAERIDSSAAIGRALESPLADTDDYRRGERVRELLVEADFPGYLQFGELNAAVVNKLRRTAAAATDRARAGWDELALGTDDDPRMWLAIELRRELADATGDKPSRDVVWSDVLRRAASAHPRVSDATATSARWIFTKLRAGDDRRAEELARLELHRANPSPRMLQLLERWSFD